MEKCVFCNPKEIKSQIIIESPSFIVIQSRRPISENHVIIMPKRHFNSLAFSNIESAEFFTITQQLSALFIKQFNASGINLLANIGKSAGQKISHLHFHLISRRDNKTKNARKESKQLTGKEIIKKVDAIKKGLDKIEAQS
jgi:diadenosine tetraphosphate (Ap4A) HIT family hydrolase